MKRGPYDAEKNNWDYLTQKEVDLVTELDEMDATVDSNEAEFLNQVITKLKEQGYDRAKFSAKQRNWIHQMDEKYLRG